MSHRKWRWIVSGEGAPSWNLALDEAILDAVVEGISPPTIRLYRWELPAISIGKFQQASRGLDLYACATHRVPIVRRMTGGRAVLHGSDQTFSIMLPNHFLGDNARSVVASYRWLSEGFISALRSLSLFGNMGECERRIERNGDCFASRSQADVLIASGEKLVGSAQCRRSGVILQQSSIRHRPPEVDPGLLFQGRVGEGTYPLESVEEDQLGKALHDAFQAALTVELEPGILDEWEYERAGTLMPGYAPLNFVDSRPSL